MSNSKTPAVSVIIATYNKSAALRYAVQSVLWQTFADFELLVVGDGCTDDSAEVVASFGDPRVRWVNLPQNSGYQSAPTNEGLRLARGRYVAYLNHDDLWLPDHLRLLTEAIESSGAAAVYSILEWVLTYADCYADIPHYPQAPIPPEASAVLHRRDFVEQIGYWKMPHETYSVPRAEFFRRAQFAGRRFQLVPRLTVLKFGGTSKGYAAAGQQPEYIERIRSDPAFAEKELAVLLVRADAELQGPVRWARLKRQVLQSLRRLLVSWKMDPARLAFWQPPGRHIRAWRKAHKLDKR
jgi:glycosyltransferase involved in cell wall biosynthesis